MPEHKEIFGRYLQYDCPGEDVEAVYCGFLNFIQKGIALSTEPQRSNQKPFLYASPWMDREYICFVNKKEFFL